MNNGRRRACLVALLLTAGCRPQVKTPHSPAMAFDALDGQQAFAYVNDLVTLHSPRASGTPAAEAAAQWIRQTIAPFTDTAVVDAFTDITPEGELHFRNVIATREGTGTDVVILGSHFDTKRGISDTFQGANDSGSSTGLLIELARVLHDQPRLPFSIVFAFFDGEECIERYGPQDGLHGSRRYAAQWEREGRLGTVRAVIILDMIGDRDLNVTLPRNTTRSLVALALQAAAAEGIRNQFGLASYAIIDDHVPFHERGLPTLNLIDFEYGSAPGRNDYWHTEQDSLEHISADSLHKIGRVTLRILNALASP